MSATRTASARALRVIHVIEAMHQGGAESLVIEHVRHAGAGVQVQVCAINRGGPALDQVRSLGARATVLRRPGARGPLARAQAIGALARLARETGATVLHGHNPTGALHAWLAARIAGVPARLRTEHSLHYAGRHSWLYPAFERLATPSTQFVVCVCDAVRESHARRLGGRAERFVTVLNGIGPAVPGVEREVMRARLGCAPEHRVVLSVGSLTAQKDQATLLAAFARVAAMDPAARLLIAGEGPLRAALEARAAAPDLAGRVRLLGERSDVTDLLEAADLFALSSVREGLPVTLIEAMRAGRAAVATGAGGCAEAIRADETGLIAPIGDASALAAAISALLGDPVRRAVMAAAARARWAGHFTAARMVAETEALYARALGEPEGAAVGGRHAPA